MTGPAADLRLRPMRDDEYPAFVESTLAGYVAAIAEAGGLSAEFARRRADEQWAGLVPDGLATEGHAFFVLEAAGERVGVLWLAERRNDGAHALYIYDIEVDEAHRGRGFGRQAMLLAEEDARRRGLDRMELNVFGTNEVARGLYRSLGYREVAIGMAKDLDPGP